jgi:hypothetical protein
MGYLTHEPNPERSPVILATIYGRIRNRGRSLVIGGIALLALSALAPPARADEPLFGFVYTTDLLPKGKFELEQWITWRGDKAHGVFNVLEGKSEFSWGASDYFQLSPSLKYAWTEARRNANDGSTLPPESFAERVLRDPNGRFSDFKFVGVAVEGIYRLLSPYIHPIGLAFYLEPTFGPGFAELESRVILQKNFLDDRLVIAFNITVAQELRELKGDRRVDPSEEEFRTRWDKETDVNFGIGVSYRVLPGWSIGLELVNEREFSDFVFWESKFANNDAYYTGPTLHYAGKNFFFTLTYVTQLPLAHDYAHAHNVSGGRNYADDFERFRVRVKLGWYF